MKERVVIPEILDELPADDPRAKRSRRDLRLINSLMGNYRWIRFRVRHRQLYKPHVWVEIGAGDGNLANFLPSGFPVRGIDFAPRPQRWPADWDWQQGDIFEELPTLENRTISEFVSGDVSEWSHRGDYALPNGLIANLFLHHFESPALHQLGQIVQQRFSRIVVSEPARYPFFHFCSYAFFPFVNDVTRHDMQVSIRAGFRRGELKAALGLGREWKHRESVTLLGAYRFEAWKE